MPTPRPGPTQPPHCPSCLTAAGGVQGTGHEVEAFHRGLLGGEVPAGADRAPVAGIDGFDRIRGADDAADLHLT